MSGSLRCLGRKADRLLDGTTAGVLGMGALCATVLGTADYTGGFRGFKKESGFDEFERKQYLRKNRRRPIEETIAEVGEGSVIEVGAVLGKGCLIGKVCIHCLERLWPFAWYIYHSHGSTALSPLRRSFHQMHGCPTLQSSLVAANNGSTGRCN